jgi:hypothetical protein
MPRSRATEVVTLFLPKFSPHLLAINLNDQERSGQRALQSRFATVSDESNSTPRNSHAWILIEGDKGLEFLGIVYIFAVPLFQSPRTALLNSFREPETLAQRRDCNIENFL